MPSTFDTIPARAERVSLSPQEVARYSRHLIMPEVGVEGQRKLKAGKVLTYDLGGSAKCSQVGSAIASRVKAGK